MTNITPKLPELTLPDISAKGISESWTDAVAALPGPEKLTFEEYSDRYSTRESAEGLQDGYNAYSADFDAATSQAQRHDANATHHSDYAL